MGWFFVATALFFGLYVACSTFYAVARKWTALDAFFMFLSFVMGMLVCFAFLIAAEMIK